MFGEGKKLVSGREEKTEKENGGTFLQKETIWSAEENKNREGKGGKYLEKENIWLAKENKRGKYL